MGGAGSKRAKPVGRGNAEGRIDRAGSVVAGGATVVVELVVLALGAAVVVVSAAVVVGAGEVVVVLVEVVVAASVVVAGTVDVVVVAESAAAPLHADNHSSRPATTRLVDVAPRPDMGGDHTDRRGGVALTMVTIQISISIDTNSDQDSADVLGERLKDLVWKEVYENMQLPASVATSYAQVS
jgi:hypothetical protein